MFMDVNSEQQLSSADRLVELRLAAGYLDHGSCHQTEMLLAM